MHLHAPLRRFAGAALLTVVLAACSSPPAADPDQVPTASDEPTVTVTGMAYHPPELTVVAGSTVSWVFDDGAIKHDVVGDGFRSDIVDAGTFSHRFEEPGTYDYLCSLHPTMTGVIEVTE